MATMGVKELSSSAHSVVMPHAPGLV